MGILTLEQIVSADGYAADEHGGLDFFESADFGDESRTDSEQMRWLRGVDGIVLGRRTYEMFAEYWPTADPSVDAAAGPINALPKHVVSTSLQRAPWGEHEIEILRDLDEVARLRSRFASLVVWGSLQLAAALWQAGLVDELRLRTVPVVIGRGRSFLPSLTSAVPLELDHVDSQRTGHVTSHYRVRR